jgi:hypothetical protein
MTQTAAHIVLLGDSIFDNAAYTQGESHVVTHLRTLLPAGGFEMDYRLAVEPSSRAVCSRRCARSIAERSGTLISRVAHASRS